MDQANADGLDALLAEILRRCANARLVERPDFLAEEIHAAADFAHMAQRHDPFRFHPEIGIAVALRHRLACDLEDMAEAFGDDEAETGDFALQQRVGGNRGAMRQAGEVVNRRAAGGENFLHAAYQSNRRI